MKKFLLLAFGLAALNSNFGFGQTTYSISPATGTYTSCPPQGEVDIDCGGWYTYHEKLQLKVSSISGSNVTFTGKNCLNATLTDYWSSFKIFEGSPCDLNEWVDIIIPNGVTEVSATVPMDFTSGSKTYYAVFVGNTQYTNGAWFYAYPITITASTPTCVQPSVPLSVTGSATSVSSANLSWQPGSPAGSPTVTYYWFVGTSPTVEYWNALDQGSTTGTSATTNALSCETGYYLRVYAVTSCNGSSSVYGTSSQFITPQCPTSCTSPSALVNSPSGTAPLTMTCTASGGSGGSILYKWYSGTSCSGTVLGTSSTYQTSSSGTYSCKAYISGYETTCATCATGTANVTASPTISVTAPLSGSFTQGGSMNITWNSSNVPFNAPITLQVVNCMDANVVTTIVDGSITNSGSYTWNNINLSQGNYRIKIYQTNNTSVNNNSQLSNSGTGCFTIGCAYSINPNTATVQAAGSSYTVNVTTQPGCNWTASNGGSSWVSVSSGSGTGNGSVTVTVGQNTGSNSRNVDITIAGQTHSISQSGVSCSAPTSASIVANPSDATVSAPNGITFTCSQVLGASSPWTYQWQRITDGSANNWGNIANATSQDLVISSTAVPMNGWKHRCVVSNACGSVNSNSITLTVCNQPNTPITSNVTQTGATLSWTGGTPTYVLRIYINGNWVEYTTNNTSYQISGLSPGTTYPWQVRASCVPNTSWVSGSFTTCASLSFGSPLHQLCGNPQCSSSGNSWHVLTVGSSPLPQNITVNWQYRRLPRTSDNPYAYLFTDCSNVFTGSYNNEATWYDIPTGTNSQQPYSGALTMSNYFIEQLGGGYWPAPSDNPNCTGMKIWEFRCVVSNSCGNLDNSTYTYRIKKQGSTWQFVGSNLSHAKVLISGTHSSEYITNEMGQIEFYDVADNVIDSVYIEYPSYHTLGVEYASVNTARSIPMLQDGSTTNLIRYPRVNFWQSSPFYNNSIPMPYYVQGENIQGFAVYQLDDTLGLIQPPVFVSSPNDSAGIIPPPATQGRYWYGFLLTGVDSAMIYKFVDFYPLASTYAVTVNAAQAFHGADVYYDGQYLRPVEQASTYTLPNGAHTLTFKRLGFADTTIYVTGAGTHTLTMQPIDHSSLTDSIAHLGVNTTNPRYWKSSTILSNDALFDVSLRQYDHPESAQWSLEPKSRLFRFRKQNGVSGSLRAAIVLDQPEYLTPDSVYLMQIYNGTQIIKQLPDVPPLHSYDSAFQKLLLDIIPFENNVSTVDYAFMKRQAPLAIAPALSAAEDTPFAVSLFDLFADPDSIPNDMTFNVTANGVGITTQVIGDSLYFTLDQDWNGTTDVTIEATHDWLTVSQSIPVEVAPVNDAPELTAQQPLTFCHGEAVLLDLNTELSDVDHDLEDITVEAEVASATYPSLASDLAIAINGQAVTFSSASEAGGVYQVAIRANDGIDLSTPQTVTVTVLPNSAYAFSQTICDGENFEGYASAGVFTDVFASANGCDSVRTLSLNVLPLAVSSIETAICQGESFEGYTAQGLYTDVFTAINGCDSTRTLNLVVNPNPTSMVEGSICAGESFEGYSAAGTYVDVFQSIHGCDSTRTLNLILNPLPLVNLGSDTAICNQSVLVLDAGGGFSSYSWNVGGFSQQLTVLEHGYYAVTVTDANGCSNTDGITVDLFALPLPPTMTVMPGSVLGSSYSEGNQWYLDGEPIEGETGQQIIPSATGVYTVVHTDQNGCSSESAGISVMVGMDEITVGGSILVFPNPNSGTFAVRIEGISGQVTLRLMDAIGKLVATDHAQSAGDVINHEFRNIANGVYMVEVVSAEQRWVQRVVVQ